MPVTPPYVSDTVPVHSPYGSGGKTLGGWVFIATTNGMYELFTQPVADPVRNPLEDLIFVITYVNAAGVEVSRLSACTLGLPTLVAPAVSDSVCSTPIGAKYAYCAVTRS